MATCLLLAVVSEERKKNRWETRTYNDGSVLVYIPFIYLDLANGIDTSSLQILTPLQCGQSSANSEFIQCSVLLFPCGWVWHMTPGIPMILEKVNRSSWEPHEVHPQYFQIIFEVTNRQWIGLVSTDFLELPIELLWVGLVSGRKACELSYVS